FSPDGTRIASGSEDGTVKVWDAEKGQAIQTIKAGSVSCVAFSPDGKWIAADAKVWKAETGWREFDVPGHQGAIQCVAFPPDGKQLVTGNEDGTLKLWNLKDDSELVLTFKGHAYPVTSVAISQDGKRLLSGAGAVGKPGQVKVWDVTSGKEVFTF